MSAPTETYLFAWNPKRFPWDDLDQQIESIKASGGAEVSWTCGSVKSIPVGSRVFLIRLGQEPRGLVGAGVTVGDVYQAPHWGDEADATGEDARWVSIRFDSLSRTPLIHRRELDAPPFENYKWDTQMSGVRIPRDFSQPLEEQWKQRLERQTQGVSLNTVSPDAVERWRELWNQANADASWVERNTLRNSKRVEVLPQMQELLTDFIGGRVSLADFRSTFDKKTKNEWDLFGLKGLSGAMFLNKLAKHLPATDVTNHLRRVLAVPKDDTEARKSLDDFAAFLSSQISTGNATTAEIQPSRALFLVSACWHAQQMDLWPIMFESARDVLQADGLLGRNLKGADGYLAFANLFRALAEGVGITFWDLEQVCARRHAAPPVLPDDSPEETDAPSSDRERVWLVAPGRRAAFFDEFYRDGIIAIGWDYLGDLSEYADLDAVRAAIKEHRGGETSPIQDALACYQFANEMEVGDVVIAKRGRKEIVGYGVVASEYRYEPTRSEYKQVRSVKWKKRGDWSFHRLLVTKTLTDIGKYPRLVAELRALIGEDEAEPLGDDLVVTPKAEYRIDDIAGEMFLPRQRINEALELLKYKNNFIVQGPPGVGKTFFAKRLAYLLLEEKDDDRIELVQFHQSYSYEDFVQGYRPTDAGVFGRADGIFLRFCHQALQDPALRYVLIIDEINRGNLSKIFGELLMLVESDKRSPGWATRLTYSKDGEEKFYIPKNLHIIGTMNTADRSLAMVDYALRRRFAFFDLGPGFGEPAFVEKLDSLGVSPALRERIVRRIDKLNQIIAADANLGEGFRIGHSYFCHSGGGEAGVAWYERIVRTEIGPLLREYWFDNREQAEEQLALLLSD